MEKQDEEYSHLKGEGQVCPPRTPRGGERVTDAEQVCMCTSTSSIFKFTFGNERVSFGKNDLVQR